MKIITLHHNEKAWIKRAQRGNRKAQKQLFDRFAPKMLGVCRRYIGDIHFAEDAMVNGFVKAFARLDDFRHEGSFEGWLRRIMIRESIDFLRRKQFVVFDDEVIQNRNHGALETDSDLETEHIQQLIDALPEGYKTVFVLYAVEGYKHHEIAKILGITEGTSKSQLFKARKQLQEQLRQWEEMEKRRGIR